LPSIITHTVVGLASGNIFPVRNLPKRFWFFSLVLPVLPDADVITFKFGIPYGHFFGHRGFFHSLFFALIVAILVVGLFFKDKRIFSKGGQRPQPNRICSRQLKGSKRKKVAFSSAFCRILTKERFSYLLYFFLLTASHGILDAFTNGGLGIALLSPFDTTRHFFPWQPIEVAPIGIWAFFSDWGVRVLWSEILWIWLPLLVIVIVVKLSKLKASQNV
jgi:inner membrane protein